MKLLVLNCSGYYEFPAGIKNIEEFVEFANNDSRKFIKMTMYNLDRCVAPYFIEEDKKTVYVNLGLVRCIEEISGEVMPLAEYERRLREAVRKKCLDCVNFEGNPDDLDGHYDSLSLDGDCWRYHKRDEDEE
ncbi:MAG: hypothetical protein IJX46_02145 [Clostridia bacterium]|nr:hypothetical protein [Clostridia bacterium]